MSVELWTFKSFFSGVKQAVTHTQLYVFVKLSMTTSVSIFLPTQKVNKPLFSFRVGFRLLTPERSFTS